MDFWVCLVDIFFRFSRYQVEADDNVISIPGKNEVFHFGRGSFLTFLIFFLKK